MPLNKYHRLLEDSPHGNFLVSFDQLTAVEKENILSTMHSSYKEGSKETRDLIQGLVIKIVLYSFKLFSTMLCLILLFQLGYLPSAASVGNPTEIDKLVPVLKVLVE